MRRFVGNQMRFRKIPIIPTLPRIVTLRPTSAVHYLPYKMASKEPHEKADDGDLTSAPRQKFQRTEEEDYGYYFYPQRSGSEEVKSFWRSLWGRTGADNFRCEANVVWCMENNPMVKLLSRALKSHGCEVNLRRHISCENCLEKVNGGFDPTTNQVVICQNNVKKRNTCCNVLAHEFIHAFDSCRAKVDFEDLHHLACTEIRAANLMHCSFLTAVAAGDASPINIKQRHAQCVKSKALQSVLMVRNVPIEKAMVIVDSVFDKCYNDLEPVGRRPRKNSRDPERALLEGQYYGYS